MPQLAAILPANGSSTRFGRNKLIEPLCGATVLARSLKAFCDHPAVDVIVIATAADSIAAKIAREVDSRRIIICAGGPTRAQSVLAALKCVPAQYEWVAIHDAARPLVSRELIDRTFAAAVEHGAAVPAMPVALTIKQATGPLPARVHRTIARHELWAMQTPQIARRADLLHAFEHCPIPLEQITDDVQLLELQGRDVWLVSGDERNLKITTTLDLKLAQLILKETSDR